MRCTRREGCGRAGRTIPGEGGCRLSTLERLLFDVRRVGDVGGFEIPSRFFQFMRSGDPRPLEPVLEHNRLDLVSLAAVTARAVKMIEEGADACDDGAQALAVGRIFERAGLVDARRRVLPSRRDVRQARGQMRGTLSAGAAAAPRTPVRRGGGLLARNRRPLTESRAARRHVQLAALREFAVEALAIHHEHRERDLQTARELAVFALEELEESVGQNRRRSEGYRHRLARLERKLAKKPNAQLLWS